MKKIFLFVLLIILSGCSYSIEDINTDKKNKECVQKCKKIHQSSITDESDNEFKSDILRSAKYTYQICISTCD